MIFNIIGVADYRLRFNRHTLNFRQPLRYRLLVGKRMCALIASLLLRTKSTELRQKKEYANIQAKQNLLLFGVLTSFEALQKSHKQEKQALKAKISDLESKQGVGITQDEFNDLKANYEAKKIGMGYKAIVSVIRIRRLNVARVSFFGVY